MVCADGVETVARNFNMQVDGGHDVIAKTGAGHLRPKRRLPANVVQDRFCIGVPTSTIPGQAFSGVSSRSGDLLSVLIKSMGVANNQQAQKLHLSLIAEVILELKESGAVLLE